MRQALYNNRNLTGIKLEHAAYNSAEPFYRRALKEFQALWRYRACIPVFVASNLRRRYQRSFFGFLWSLLNPLLSMVIMTSVFSVFFHKAPGEFALYIFSGLLPWTFLTSTFVAGCGAIVEAEAFLKKLNVPKLMFPMILVATESANFLFSLVSLVLLALFIGLSMQPTVLALPLVLVPTICFTLGVTIILSVSTVYFRDIAHIVGVALGGMFYLTPVLYPISVMPASVRSLFKLNPFYHVLALFRAIVYEGRLPTIQESAIVWALAIVALISGISLYLWKERDMIYRL